MKHLQLMKLNSKTVKQAVEKHGVKKLFRRIDLDVNQITSLDLLIVAANRIETLEMAFSKLKRYIAEHGISGVGEIVGKKNRKRLRRINHIKIQVVIDSLDCFEVERFYELSRLEAGFCPA